jgi:hypothetical protein
MTSAEAALRLYRKAQCERWSRFLLEGGITIDDLEVALATDTLAALFSPITNAAGEIVPEQEDFIAALGLDAGD